MKWLKSICLLVFVTGVMGIGNVAEARIKLAAVPERGDTLIRLDNPQATLIEEERVLTLQKGLNKVDFAWKGVSVDADSIRLKILSHPKKVSLLNVSYPPNEAALVWKSAVPEHGRKPSVSAISSPTSIVSSPTSFWQTRRRRA